MLQSCAPQPPRAEVYAYWPLEDQSIVGSQQVPPCGSAADCVQAAPPLVEYHMICPEPGPLEPATTLLRSVGWIFTADSAAPVGEVTLTSVVSALVRSNSSCGVPRSWTTTKRPLRTCRPR